MADGGRTVAPRTTPLDDPRRIADPDLELSIVMPCLNERDSVGACIGNAAHFLETAISANGANRCVRLRPAKIAAEIATPRAAPGDDAIL